MNKPHGWLVQIGAEDGRHASFHASLFDAIKEVEAQAGAAAHEPIADWIGTDPAKRRSLVVVDDWGRRIVLGAAPPGLNSAAECRAFLAAFDARECGVETEEQRALLRRVEG